MNWLLSIITLVVFLLLFTYLWRKINHAVWLAEEYSEFCYHLEMWIRDGEAGMGWADTLYKHQWGLCNNWNAYIWSKYPAPEQHKLRLQLAIYQKFTLFDGKEYVFGDAREYHMSANKYTNQKRLDHIHKHARRFA